MLNFIRPQHLNHLLLLFLAHFSPFQQAFHLTFVKLLAAVHIVSLVVFDRAVPDFALGTRIFGINFLADYAFLLFLLGLAGKEGKLFLFIIILWLIGAIDFLDQLIA